MDFEINILLQADDFYEAYHRCIEGKDCREENGVTIYSVVNVPAIVNASFACELYMKSMAGKERTKHDLLDFYHLLPQDIKEEIEQHYKNRPVPNYGTFEMAIGKVKNAFVDWRYLYKTNKRKQCTPKTLNEFLWIFSTITPILKEVAHNH